MRYIDLDKLRMPAGWIGRANLASTAVAGGGDPNDYGNVWRELKDAMHDLSDYKCWYCESIVDRADNAVDHFRPKKRVSDAIFEHLGYRWLAFEKSNFRLACTYCNSKRIDVDYGTEGGKADRFPLIDEATRVYTIGSVEGESPKLLDPCDLDDCELLGCRQENGEPCPAGEEAIDKLRAEVSIEIYHLDRDSTCRQRHKIVVTLISDILDAKRLFILSQTDPTKKLEFVKVAKRIQRSICKEAAYSGEMKYLLRGQRSDDHPWIRKILEA